MFYEKDKKYVKKNLKQGNLDNLVMSNPNLTDSIILTMFRNGYLSGLQTVNNIVRVLNSYNLTLHVPLTYFFLQKINYCNKRINIYLFLKKLRVVYKY